MTCTECSDLHMLRKDGSTVTGVHPVPEMLELHYPCPYCEGGREMAKIFLMLREEWSKTIEKRTEVFIDPEPTHRIRLEGYKKFPGELYE
jgi:hypothetical protein